MGSRTFGPHSSKLHLIYRGQNEGSLWTWGLSLVTSTGSHLRVVRQHLGSSEQTQLCSTLMPLKPKASAHPSVLGTSPKTAELLQGDLGLGRAGVGPLAWFLSHAAPGGLKISLLGGSTSRTDASVARTGDLEMTE